MTDQQNDLFPAKAKRAKGKKTEENLQIAICEYIRMQYPNIIFTCDLASGMKMPIWLAARNKKMRSSRGLPDLFIATPTQMNGCHYNGLFVELKAEGTRLMKQGGGYATPHIKEQAAILERLTELKYVAHFACGFDDAKNLIDTYLGLKKF